MRLHARGIQLLALTAAAVAATWPTWPTLAALWSESQDYSHGYVIAVLAVVWLARRALAPDAPAPRALWTAWPLLMLAALVWLVAHRAHSSIGQQAVAPVVIWAAIAVAQGPQVARYVLPPIALFYFAIPLWTLAVPLLQSMATFVAEHLLAALRIPVLIEGTLVHLGAGTFEIAEGCSGLRSLVVSLATGAVMAASRQADSASTAAYLAAVAALAIVANWVRIMVIIVAGHVTDMQHYLVSSEHLSFGWGVFAVVLIGVVLIGARMLRPAHRHAVPAGPLAPAGVPGSAARGAWAVFATIATLALLPVAVVAGGSPAAVESAVDTLRLPRANGDWQGPLSAASPWSPHFAGASAAARGKYVSGTREVEVYVAEYATQTPGRELLHFGNSVANEDWITIEVRRLDASAGAEALRRNLLAAPDGTRWIVAHAFEVGPLRTGSAWMTQLAYGALSLRREAPARVLAVAYLCADDCTEADAVLRDFLAVARPFDRR